MRNHKAWVVLLAGLLQTPCAHALNWDLGNWNVDWNNRLTIGMAIREEAQDPNLIGKSNLDPSLCASDECLSASPANRASNDRYLAAPGAKNMVYDEGDLNYKQGDLVSAPFKWTQKLSIHRDHLKFQFDTLAFYDVVNANLQEYHPNQVTTAGPEVGHPVYSNRPSATLRDIGYNVQILDAYVADTFQVADRAVDVSFGRQRLVWGESSFVTQGSLNVINPPDVNNLVRPGMDLDEVYRPVGMLLVRAPLLDNLFAEGFWQFEWRPAALPPRGSYLSFFNAGNEVTPNEGIVAPFAKTPYDPLQIGTPQNPVFALVTQTSFTLRRGENHEPNQFGLGQFGFATYYRPEWLGGSELGFYFANYHARIPNASATAASASCLRREGNPSGQDATDLSSLITTCGAPGAHMREAVPLSTAHYFLDYPENIKLFGLSFSTVVNGLAVRGELAYRPNQPVQVDLEDVLFAALQPALPRRDIPLFDATNTPQALLTALQDPGNGLSVAANAVGNVPGAIGALQGLLGAPSLLGTTVPGSRTAIPDFVTAYRGGTPGEVTPGQYIRGYERMQVFQTSLGLTRVIGNSHFLGSEDSAILGEITSIWLPDLPSLSQLQFEGPGTDTAYGPGAYDTNNAIHINPISNRDGYVTSFSWGYRLGMLMRYEDVILPGLSVRPFLVFTHDVSGVSPGLGENFLKGRKLAIADVRLAYGDYEASITQTTFFGGGDSNTLHDRDFISFSIGTHF